MNADELKAYARERGADLVGIAAAERFASLPAERNPLSIFPECKSVIVIGRRVLRGAMRGVEEGTNFGSTYGTFGYRWLEDNFLSRTTYDLTIWIENQSVEAVPLFGYSEEGMPKAMPVAPGKPAPNVIVDLDYAAQAAGLGTVGLGGFLLTPEYGTRQRLAMILVDVELTPDPVATESLCDNCGACVQACPLAALDPGQRTKTGVPGAETETAKLDLDACRACANGAMQGSGRGSKPDRIAAACGRACLVHLEEAGRVGNAFAQKFRKRTPWALDALRRPVSTPCAKNAAAAQDAR